MPGDYEVLFNGVEIDRFRAASAHAGGERAIFFCGRHDPRKGLEVLLAAHARMPRDVQLWIASDGPDTARLRHEYSGDPIEWLGRISDEAKIARLKGAAVFCAPSLRGESFGVVLIEAMAAGTTVVAGRRSTATATSPPTPSTRSSCRPVTSTRSWSTLPPHSTTSQSPRRSRRRSRAG